MIKVTNLCKSYKDAEKELVVLKDLNASFDEGKSYAIVGQSGVGKSTLLHLLGGLVTANSGEVSIFNQKVSELSGDALSDFRGENIGFVYQFHHLLPEFNALENVAMPLIINGEQMDKAIDKAKEVLEFVGLEERGNHKPFQLSGGEQQRVAICRAVITKPKVILADEPTGNLDPKTAEVVLGLLLEMGNKNGSTLIVVTHQQDSTSKFDFSYLLEKDSKELISI